MRRILFLFIVGLYPILSFGATSVNEQFYTITLASDKNITNQFIYPNTIYNISSDLHLNGKTIDIPSGCTLNFVGGKLISGCIKGNGTVIIAMKNQIFDSVLLEGSWNVDCAYPEWFGAKGDGVNDDTKAIQACINVSFSKIILQHRTTPYVITAPLVVARPIVIEGDNGFGNDSYAKIQAAKNIEAIFYLKSGCVRSTFSNLYIDGKNRCVSGFYSSQGQQDSYLYMNTFTNVKVVFVEYGFRLNKLYSCVFNSCQCNSISKIGFCFNKDLTDGSEGTTLTAINCGSSTWNEKGGIGWFFNKLSYCNLISCGSDDNDIAYEFKDCSNFSLLGCGCEKTGTPMVFDYDGYSMGFTISSFRITDLKKTAPYDWILYSGGLYNTTISGVYINSRNKRAGDIYTRYDGSSIVVMDKSSISPQKCSLAGTAVLFPSLNISRSDAPAFKGQLYVDDTRMAIAKQKSGRLVWETIYGETTTPLMWSHANAFNVEGGYRESEKIVFVNIRFISRVSSSDYCTIAGNLPMNELGESFMKITDSEGNESYGIKAKINASTIQASGISQGETYLVTGFYFVK